MVMGRFIEVCMKRGLKVNSDKKQGDGVRWDVRSMWMGQS